MKSQRFLAAAMLGVVVLWLAAGCGAPAQKASSASASTASSAPTGGALVPPITFLGPSQSWTEAQFAADQLISQDWQKLGLKVNLVTSPDWTTFTGQMAHQPWQVAAGGYLGTQQRIDPTQLTTTPFLCHLPSNYGDYCDPAYDTVAKQASATLNQSQRHSLVDQAQVILARDLPVIAEFYPKEEGLYNKQSVTGVVPALGVGLFNFWDFIQSKPLHGSTLNVGTNDMGPLNPFDVGSYNSDVEVQDLIYDTLVRIDPHGNVVPWAAKSWQAKGSLQLDVTLRSGIRFSDGTPLTAKDVAWTYTEMKKLNVPYYLAQLRTIKSVTATGPHTVVFKMNQPNASLVSLTFSQLPIMPEHIWASVPNPAKVSQPNMTGSGPYKLVSFNPTGQTVLVANPDAFHAPATHKLVFTVYASGQSFFAALQAGSVAYGNQPLVNPSMVVQAKSLPQVGVISNPGITVRWMAYNMKSGSPFANYAFRLALSHAIDYKTIVTAILHGTGTAGDGIIAPANTAWHDTAVHFPSFNMATARGTLKKAGYTWDSQGRLHYPAQYKPQLLPAAS